MIADPIRHKLREAEYFLNRMRDAHLNDEEFMFNISAFLSAALGITDNYLPSQYKKCQGFKAWFNEQKTRMKEDEELNSLRNYRITAVHHRPVGPALTVWETGFTMSSVILSPHEHASDSVENEEAADGPPDTISVNRYFGDYPSEDILDFCERQLNKLTSLATECEEKFLEAKRAHSE